MLLHPNRIGFLHEFHELLVDLIGPVNLELMDHNVRIEIGFRAIKLLAGILSFEQEMTIDEVAAYSIDGSKSDSGLEGNSRFGGRVCEITD